MAIGLAVNSGQQDQKERLADLLENAAVQAINLGLYVEGKPFDVTLRQIADQLVPPVNVYSRRPHRSA